MAEAGEVLVAALGAPLGGAVRAALGAVEELRPGAW